MLCSLCQWTAPGRTTDLPADTAAVTASAMAGVARTATGTSRATTTAGATGTVGASVTTTATAGAGETEAASATGVVRTRATSTGSTTARLQSGRGRLRTGRRMP